MQILTKKLEKVFKELYKLNPLTKNVIKYGVQISLALLILGTALLFVNHRILNFDSYIELISTTIIKSSFTILAEVIIGGLLVDYVHNKG